MQHVMLAAVVLAASSSTVYPLHRVAQVALEFSAAAANPWAVTDCSANVRGPTSSRHAAMTLPLFFDGTEGDNLVFAFRLTPDIVGTWAWQLDCTTLTLAAGESPSGSIQVTAAGGGRGGAVASPRSPQQFEREDGSRWTPVGYEIDWLWALGMDGGGAASIAPVESTLDVLSGYGFNHLLVSLYANHSGWNQNLPKAPPHIWWAEQVHNTPWVSMSNRSELNLRFLRHWDNVLNAADTRDVVVHLMFYVGNKNVDWPERLSAADDIYWRNVLARFAAHPAVIIDVSKEAASYGIGSAYILNRLAMIHASNAHKRLVTAHSGLSWTEKCAGCGLTMLSTQTHKLNQSGGEFYSSVRKLMDANPTTPVANVEFMYSAGVQRLCNGSAGHDCAAPTADGCGNDPSKYEPGHCADLGVMRKNMWSYYMALSSSTWYDCDTAWDVISLPSADAAKAPVGYRWMGYLAKFWEHVDRSQMRPCGAGPLDVHDKSVHGHCIRSGSTDSDQAILYLWGRSSFSFHHGTGKPMKGFWYDPLTGANQTCVTDGKELSAPAGFMEDAVLYLSPA